MVEERLVYGETGIEEIVGLVEGRLVGVWIVWYRSDWCMDSMVKKRLVYGEYGKEEIGVWRVW